MRDLAGDLGGLHRHLRPVRQLDGHRVVGKRERRDRPFRQPHLDLNEAAHTHEAIGHLQGRDTTCRHHGRELVAKKNLKMKVQLPVPLVLRLRMI